MAVKSSRDELHKLFQQRTGFAEAPIDYTKYSNKQVSTSRQLSARQQQDEYRIAMRRLGYEFSTDSTYAPEGGESRLSPSYAFTTGQQRDAQASIKELMEKYRQQDEYRKESRELQPLDRTALMPKDTSRLSPEILRSEVASGVRDWQAYDLAKKELDTKYPDRIYREPEPRPVIKSKVQKPQELKSKIDSAMTDTGTGKTKEVVKEEVMKIFGIPIKPIWKVTAQDLKNDAQYMGASVTREVGRVAGAMTPQALANNAFLLASYTANAPYNFLASKFGWKQLENKTLTRAVTDVVKSAGVSPIPTANIENQTVKNIVNDINNGVDVIEGLNKRSMQYFGKKADEVALFVAKPMKIATSVVQTLPQMALMALPQGQLAYSVSTISSALQEATKNGTITTKDMGYALSSASIEVVSEMIFGLFSNAESLFPGALSALNIKAGAPTVYQLIKGIAMQGFEESLEEIVAYPFQAFIDWRYKHPEQTLSEFATWEKALEWGEAGLVGFLAGAIMSTPTAVRMGKMTRQEAIELQQDADELLNSKASDLNEKEVLDFAEKVAANIPPTEAKATEAMFRQPEVPTTEDFNVVVDEQNNMRREEQPATMPVEAPTRPSERVQEPVVSVPSEEPAIAPEAPSEVPRQQQAPAEEPKQEAKTVEQKAVDTFGITNVPYEAGYILQDGRTLDFSEKNDGGEPGTRTRDHRDVQQFYEGFDTATEAMSQFIEDTGAVRVGIAQNNAFADIIISKPITDKQKRKLANMFSKRESVSIDIYQNAKDNAPIKSITLEMPLMSTITKAIDDAYKIEQPSEATSEQAPAVDQTTQPVKKEAPKAKKKRQYYSLLTNAEGKPTPSPVDGKAIKLDGMPNTEFFVRKVSYGKKNSWSIVEASSGVAIVDRQSTRKVAVDEANSIVERLGADKILEKVNEFVNKYGSMPVEFVEEVKDVQQQPEKPKEPPKITYVHGKTAADFHVAPEPKVETKAEPTPKAQAEETYEDIVAEVSSAQDTRGRLNIVPPIFQGVPQQAQATKKQERMIDYKGVEDAKVRAEFDSAKRPLVSDGKPLVVRIRDSITRNLLRASVPEVGFEQGQVRTDIRKLRQRFSITATETWEEIKGIYNPLGKDYKTQMDYAVFLPDLVEDINLGKYKNGRRLPFSFNNIQQVIDENDRIQRLIQDPMDTTVKNALDRRRKIYLANQKKVNDLAEKLDVDFSGYFSRQDYVHHAIMEYMENALNNPELKRSAINILRTREGSQKAYITDSTLADFLALQKLKEMQMKLEALQTLKELDITDTLEIDEDGNRIIKDGYVEIDSTLVQFTFPNEMLKTQAVNTANAFIDKFKLDRSGEAAKKLLSDANKTHKNKKYIVPIDVADAYANMFKSKGYANDFDEAYMKVMGLWKAYQLMAPRRAFTYQLRNSVSDFAKTFAFMPKAISFVPKATSMLTKYMLGVETSADLLRYIGAGGLEGGITNIELGDYKSLDKLNVYDSEGKLKPLSQIINAITKPLNGMENFYQWREQIFRFAGYMYFYHEGLNKNNLPKDGNYRASKRAEIQSIRKRSDVAYKMSNDIVGAYDDTTPFTQFISRRLQPFFRFQETNNKAYFRGLLNTFYNDPNLIKEVGENTASRFAKGVKLSAYTAMRLGKFAIMASLVDLVLDLWNKVIRKEEDEQVPSYVREESHITIGKWGNKVYYLSNVGSLREALEWVGMNEPYKDFYDIATGKKTYKQKVLEIIKAPGLRMTESIAPLLTPIFELKTGQKMYSGQYIRDDWEYVAELLQLKPAYRALTGKPQIEGKFNWNPMSLQKAFENEAYFWDIYDLRDQYYISQGREPLPPYPPSTNERSKALYQFRTAVRYNDSEAAKRYLELYMALDGDLNGIKASARAITPLQGMSKKDREAFVSSLTGHDKYVYEKGMEFYAKYADDMIKFAEKYMD